MDGDDEKFMRIALDACRRGVDAGQSPFGSCIVRDGKVLAASHNHVWLQTDPTAHAEVTTIREACRSLKQVHLEGATIYSTTEPCPMCFCAIHWARIGRIVYGATIPDAASFGFNEMDLSNAQIKSTAHLSVELVPGFMRDEAVDLFEYWKQRGGRSY